jgi:hypothetical protein
MRKLLSLFAIIICLAILFYPKISNSYSTGSPGGKTGSPTDGVNCTQCHTAGSGTGATITTNIPSTGYVPGTTYTITATVAQTGINKFGFEITAEKNAGGTKTGTFFVTNSTQTKLINNNTAITHEAAGTSGTNNKSWSMDWQAPTSGTGAVTFYGSYIAANGNGQNTGDTYHPANLTFNESIPGCTNPLACNYNALATVDNGSCTYPAANADCSGACLAGFTSVNGSCICNKTVAQALVGFNPNPVYGPWIWSYDTLSLANTSNCDIRIRPEFDISNESLAIGSTDFDLKWYNPYISAWSDIFYTIAGNGHAVGIWGLNGDTTGIIINPGTTNEIIIRIRFNPIANYGSYSAIWQTNEVDNLGNFIQHLDLDSTSLDYVNCSIFEVDSSYSSNITCFNANDGSASVLSIQNGSGNYLYSWNNGYTTNTISNLNTGNYFCVVTDINWQQCSDTIEFSISEPNPITILIDSISNISTYGGNDGYIYISTTGGSGVLSTNWTNDNGFSSNNEDITSLSFGLYYLEITDNNSCTYLDTIELSQSSSLLWMNLDLAINTSCFDSCNGGLNITAYGGDSTYTYTWTGPNGFTSTNDDLTNLCDGAYIITIDDGITTLTDTLNIYQPQPITSNLSVDSIICHNGFAEAEINVWGGTQPLIYNWSNGGNSYITTVSSGTYSINVTDQNGCSINRFFSLTNPNPIINTTTSTNINCFGGSNGTATVTPSGGTAPYSYLWSNGQTTATATGLSAGTYTCTITDFNSCLDIASINVVEADEISSTTASIDASCYDDCDGSISVIATGGTPPFTYTWNNGQSTQTATGLCVGFYNVIITDDNNCLEINSAIVNEPNPLLINVNINGASLVATSGFVTYQWYTASGTLITGATSEIFNPSSMGEYYVVVTDGNCEETSYTINYTISGLSSLDQSIKIYPNPTNGLLTIEGTNANHNITVMTFIGNQLLKVENNSKEGSSTKLDLSTFAKGIYFIQIEQNNQIMNYRIVLQ